MSAGRKVQPSVPAPTASAAKACSSRRNRRYLRRRRIEHTIPEPKNQRANRQRRGSRGGRPTGFDETIHRRGNEVERTIDAPKNFRAVATRFDKRVHVFQGTVTVAAIRLRLRGWIHCLGAGMRPSPFFGMIFTPDLRL